MPGSLLTRYTKVLYFEQPRRTDMHQTIFLIPLVLVLVPLALFRTDVFLSTQFLMGVGVLAVATLAAFAGPWKQVPRWCVASIPTLNFVAIALCRDAGADQTAPLSLLCFFPAVWLALLFKSRGAIIATAFTVLAATMPSLTRMTGLVDPFVVICQLLLPLVILLFTAMLVVARTRFITQQRELTNQAHDLHFSLMEAERNARLLDNIINSVSVGIVVVDADGNDIILNRAQEPIHALASPSDNSDQTESGHHIYHRNGITPFDPAARAVYRAIQGETFRGLMMNVGKPGTEQRVVSAAAQPIVNTDGEREGAVIVFNDITDISELTRNREAFVSAVSHELRTPITSIVGYLDLVRDSPEPRSDETTSYLEVISRNAEQVLRIIDDLLTSAQVNNGSIQLKKVPTDISALARATVESARIRAAARHITLQGNFVDLPKGAVDPARVAQVLDNLVSNAIKYTPEGGAVMVQTFADPAAAMVNVEVSDTGIGLSQADLSKLFTPYFRTQAAMNSALPGTGLGLTISRGIVEAHGGYLSVESTPKVGTTFTVGLPCGD